MNATPAAAVHSSIVVEAPIERAFSATPSARPRAGRRGSRRSPRIWPPETPVHRRYSSACGSRLPQTS